MTISSKRTEARVKLARPELISNFPRITYKELSEATGGFDNQRLVGSGSVRSNEILRHLKFEF